MSDPASLIYRGYAMPEPSFHPSNFILIPTAACQASCVYCFGPNRGETMSRRIADGALAFMARIAPAESSVHVTFHGGEPLQIEAGDALMLPANCTGIWDVTETVRKTFVLML